MAAQYTGEPPSELRATRLLDGATGTELERLGLDCAAPLWSARALVAAPDAVREIHRAYAAAGADALTANTFRTQPYALRSAGWEERAADLSALAIALAREGAVQAGRSDLLVFGSAAPLEDCYEPQRVPPAATLAREHARHARNLVRAGADAVWVETMNTRREACAAALAAREAGAAVWVSFVCGDGARLLSGEPLAEALDALRELTPMGVGVNCAPAATLAAAVPTLRASGLPFSVYANTRPTSAGLPEATPLQFAESSAGFADAGASWIGGCCGTTPAHLAALQHRLRAGDVRLSGRSSPR
jgi:S-methylmethionine-dependent homocysteine/selenocysteine methylase